MPLLIERIILEKTFQTKRISIEKTQTQKAHALSPAGTHRRAEKSYVLDYFATTCLFKL